MPMPYAELQALNQTSPLIELFRLDCTKLGGTIYRFTNESTPVVHAGQTYLHLPILCEGWDFTSTGAPAKPRVTVSNAHRTLLADVIGLGDLVGAEFTRIRVYAKHLDAATFERRNLLNYSEDLSNSYWNKSGTLSITPNSHAGPDGRIVADTITDNSTTATETMSAVVSTSYTSGTAYTLTAMVRKDSVPKTTRVPLFRIQFGSSTNRVNLGLDTSTGELLNVNPAGVVTLERREVIDAGDYWKCILSASSTAVDATSVRVVVYPAVGTATTTTVNIANSAQGGITIGSMQAEVGVNSTPYQFTTTSHQPYADPTKLLGPEVYVVEQKLGHNKNFIQFQLASAIDRFGIDLPRRQILKDKGFPGVSRTRIVG